MKLSLAFLTLCTCVAYLQPYRFVGIQGNSMAPTLEPGQIVAVRPLDRELRHGDVVVFNIGGERTIKRVMFCPGDSFPMVFQGGEWCPAYSSRHLKTAERKNAPMLMISVRPGTVYVVGDNWYNSCDSRDFGPVSTKDIESYAPSLSRPDVPIFAGARLAQPTA